MKKISSALLLVLCIQITGIFAQVPKVQRMVLAEEFTNASCGPCASQNPAFDALLQANPTKVVSIKYHTNWPGVDPMNAHNPSDVGQRVTYYGVTGVPYCRLDGVATTGGSYTGAPSNLTQAKIDQEYAVPSNFDIQVNHFIPATNDSVYITLLVHALNPDSGQLVVHTGVIEKHIHFTSPPGQNGETDFYNVMIKMLPGSNGIALPGHMEAGDYMIYQYSWPFTNVYNTAEVAAVSFVQDNANKNVRQAAMSSTNPVTPIYSNDATITAVTNIPLSMCSDALSPIVTIRNNGSQAMTSLDIQYSVNGGPQSTYHWTGNLAFLEKAVVSLPVINFNLSTNNTVTVHTLNPNGTADNYTKNDTYSVNFDLAPYCFRKMHLTLKTDNSPEQTTWAVKDENGTVIQASGVLSNPNTIYNTDIVIPANGCYTYEIYDAGGNGICCTNGYGYYQLADSTGTVVAEGNKFGSQEISAFTALDNVGIHENTDENFMKVFPNPFSDQLTVEITMPSPGPATVMLFNILGSKVYESKVTDLNAGINQVKIPVAEINKGVYLLKVETERGIFQTKVSKEL